VREAAGRRDVAPPTKPAPGRRRRRRAQPSQCSPRACYLPRSLLPMAASYSGRKLAHVRVEPGLLVLVMRASLGPRLGPLRCSGRCGVERGDDGRRARRSQAPGPGVYKGRRACNPPPLQAPLLLACSRLPARPRSPPQLILSSHSAPWLGGWLARGRARATGPDARPDVALLEGTQVSSVRLLCPPCLDSQPDEAVRAQGERSRSAGQGE